MPTDLELSILKTICWFSVFQYPVTSFEIWKWLFLPARPYDLFEVSRCLETSAWLATRIRAKDGHFHALLGDAFIEYVTTRQKRYLDAVKKFKKVRRASHFFHALSSVRGVAVVNSMAFWNTTETSDMDLFVVTKNYSIWSTRFWMVVPFILLGSRPDAHNESNDPFCFSFFADTSELKMQHLSLDEKDYYFAFWLKSLVPVFDRDAVFVQLAEQNKWVDRLLPNAKMRVAHHLHKPQHVPAFIRHLGFVEPLYRRLQHKRFPESIQSIANKDSRVVINDHILKFHDNDRREQFRQEFQHRLTKML